MSEYFYDGPFGFLEDDNWENDYTAVNPELQFLPQEWSMEDYYFERLSRMYEGRLSQAISGGKIDINRRTSRVPAPSMAMVKDMRLKRLDCVEATGDTFFMDAIIVADIDIAQEARGKWVTDQVNQWFRVRGYIDLLDARKNRIGDEILVYDRRDRRPGRALSDALRPIMSLKDMDDEAETILRKNGMDAEVDTCMPVDPFKLAFRQKLDVKDGRISRRGKIQGKTYLHDTWVKLYKEDGSSDVTETAPKTVYLDYSSCKSRAELEEVLAHECVHPEEHSLYFQLQRINNDRLDFLACFDARYRDEDDEEEYEGILEEERIWYDDMGSDRSKPAAKSELEWVEWQARNMGRRIKMPAKQTKRKIIELIAENTDGERTPLQVMEKVISALAEFYVVTEKTARQRTIELGFPIAKGVGIVMDGEKVPSYKTSTGIWPKGITYAVEFDNAVWLMEHDEAFQKAVRERSYVYLEHHFVLKSDKYVRGGSLTDYARAHIDECCLAFHVGRKGQLIGHDKQALHNDATCQDDPIAAALASAPVEVFLAITGSIEEKCKDLPSKLGKTFEHHREGHGLSQEELAWRMQIDDRTIRRIENGEQKEPTQQFIGLAGITMHLEGVFTEDMMNKAGKPLLRDEPEDMILKFVIYFMYLKTVEECNVVLAARKCKLLKARKSKAA